MKVQAVKLALSLLLLGAVGARADEVLRVGTSGDYAPFSLEGKGFDVDVAELFARDLGARIEWVRFRWPELRERLERGDFDVVMSGVTWTPERAPVGWMTHAVARGGPCLVGDPRPARAAVNRGGALEQWARQNLDPGGIVAVEDNLSLPRLLAAGSVDAFVTDSFEAPHLAPADREVTCFPPRGRKVYWVSPKRAADLGPKIDRWIAANEERLVLLRERWLGAATRLDGVDHLMDLVGRRFEMMALVAAAKRSAGKAVRDPARESRVIEAVSARARAAGLDRETVERLQVTMITISRDLQERASGAAPPFDLDRDLRPALSSLDARIVEALAAVTPLDGAALGDDRLEPLRVTLTEGEIAAVRDALLAVSMDAGGEAPVHEARTGPAIALRPSGPTLVVAGAGLFDPSETGSPEGDRARTLPGFQLELRVGPKLHYVGPVFGLLANTEGGFMGYAGLHVDVGYGRWTGTPIVSLGAYEEGDGKRLGGVFEFHIGGSITYEVANGVQLGFTYAHLSNAYIHDDNPGTELLLGTVGVPLSW